MTSVKTRVRRKIVAVQKTLDRAQASIEPLPLVSWCLAGCLLKLKDHLQDLEDGVEPRHTHAVMTILDNGRGNY